MIKHACMYIHAGLQLRLKGKKQSLESFSYTWALTTKVPRTLDWTTLSKENIPLTKHIRYHPLLLQDGKSLPEFVGTLNSDQYTQALILINTDNTYQIDPKIFSGDEQWALPILMVTSESGKQLDTILSRYPQNTEVKVSLTSIHADAEADSSLTENWINVKQNGKHNFNIIIYFPFHTLTFTTSFILCYSTSQETYKFNTILRQKYTIYNGRK